MVTAVLDVNVAEYVPLPLSRTGADNVPAVVDIVIVSPPTANGTLFASRSVTVMTDVLTPSARIEVFDAAIDDLPGSAVSRTNTTWAVLVGPEAARPPTVYVKLAVAGAVLEVNVAVYVPSWLSVAYAGGAGLSEPAVVVMST